MDFHQGRIEGVIWKPLRKYDDPRGWLCELFRHDEMPSEFHPVMAYVSLSAPGIARGPHEHAEQADFFCFLGPGNFKVYLWDNRAGSATYWARQTEVVGADRPMALLIPPGVAHAYQNISSEPGLVYNSPNRLFKGPKRKEPVDEIRHEDDPRSPFQLD
ncbi:MAG TPA: dTDP-4-dehydrorhamnose 3,5-epimerase family protein [Gemmataceae bacterium]|nr:dTDP-4-dehydrorhamnose 3,5-epimerase family protein [Gemmataceae bacterium]